MRKKLYYKKEVLKLNDLETIQSQYEKLESQQKVFEEMLLDILTQKQKLVKKYLQSKK